MRELNGRDILHQFPPAAPSEKTIMVLMTPKTESSVRTVYLPDSVIQNLKTWRAMQGADCGANELVFAYPDGRPYQETTLTKHFQAQLHRSGLPNVTFHSLRHSSISYKLVLTGGNIKAVQGDSGHAQADMVTEVYGHILENSRKRNADLFEAAFFPPQTVQASGAQMEPNDETNG